MRIAYFCSAYPAISHTFILREVEALRRLGLRISTFSIRRTPADQLLAENDRSAAASTTAILPFRRRQLVAHARLLLRSPGTYLSTLRGALRLAPPGVRGRLWQLFYFAEAVVLWSECRKQGIRHIHVHLANAAADIALLATRIGSAVEPERPWTWSFTMHGPTEFHDLRHFRLAEKVRSAHFVVCISDFARSQLMSVTDPEHWDRLHVVHVGIPVAQFTRSSERNGSDRTPVILYIGRLVPEKGQTILLEAVARLTERRIDVELQLAGDGALRPELESAVARLDVADRVSFLGAVGQEELRELYERAAIFCLPSFAEGVPVVLMEAMAMGLPVVTTRIAGIPELVEHGRSGVLVAPGRADELTDSLAHLLEEPEARRALGANGRQAVTDGFDCEGSAVRLQALFASQCPPS
ncbi:MAG TPA: glycosyltransferase family 4 protein [Solirubrobacterales bacterium]|jgi:glycosyltransferase involved in cell wall biosynthesis|nr:glycosyltransferase family 4 protein [Solirubrobacterales bacterium]